jgi:hypothetical protein
MIAAEIANFVTLDIAHLLRLFAACFATTHPIRSTNGRVIPAVAKVGASLPATFRDRCQHFAGAPALLIAFLR